MKCELCQANNSGFREHRRPKKDITVRDLIRSISKNNQTWGTPRIQSELELLGYKASRSTILKYMYKSPKPPSQTWKTFLKNHASEILCCDFFTVPTISFRSLYVYVILSLDRRRILHYNVTYHPTAEWTSRQLIQALPFDESEKYKYIIRDNDGTFGEEYRDTVKALGLEDKHTSFYSPWQNGYVERLIGTIKRECTNRIIVLSENHLKKVLKEYCEYYHNSRTHLSLDGNSPNPREVESPTKGKVVAIPKVGGLHYHYKRVA